LFARLKGLRGVKSRKLPVKTGVQRIYSYGKGLDSGACPGPDPGFAGMTEKRLFRLFTKPSIFDDLVKSQEYPLSLDGRGLG
jgi:hypothetical protein